MVPFTVPEEMGNNKEFVISRIIHCLREGLSRCVHEPEKVRVALFGMVDSLDPEYQCEAIQCLTALPDSEHDKVAQYLLKLFNESASYLKPVLEALRVLNLRPKTAEEIRQVVEDKFDQYSDEEIPLAVRFMLHNCQARLTNNYHSIILLLSNREETLPKMARSLRIGSFESWLRTYLWRLNVSKRSVL